VCLFIITPQAEILSFKGFSYKTSMAEPLNITLGIDQLNLKFWTVLERFDSVVFEFGE